MPDLFDPLRNVDDLPVHPLPADDVRRKGDRMRRRRHAMQGLGVAAAVALVASGTALGLSTLDDPNKSDGAPVSAPEDGWLTEIPTHYPLDRGYPMAAPPETSQLGPSQKFAPLSDAGIEPCGATSYPSSAPIDSVGTTFVMPGKDFARELTIYPDSATADTVLDRMVEAWQACPSETLPDPPFESTTSVSRDSLGDESWTVVEGAPGFPGLQTYSVARVGNAVLIDTVSSHATLEDADRVLDEQAAQVGPLVADMCIFALTPCQPVDPPETEPKIPPLADSSLLTTEQVTDTTRLTGLEQLGDREDPTLDCQADWARNTGASKGGFREWSANGAEVALAVLEYADAAKAREGFLEVRGWVADCTRRIPATRPLQPVDDLTESKLGDSDTFQRRFSVEASGGGVDWLDQQGAALVGTRVVLLSVAVRPSLRDEEDLLDAWVATMFKALEAAAPVEVEPPGVDIPDDFPLLDGWPTDAQAESESYGRTGPSRTLDPLAITRCGETYEAPAYVDQLRASWSNPEDGRYRELTTYADADAAVAAVEGLAEFYRACTSTPSPDLAGNVSHYVVSPTNVGGQSFGLVHYFTYDGAPAIGLELHHVIRVGRAVLIITEGSHGGGPDQDDQLARQADEASAAIAAMCLFTEAGC